MCLNIWLFIYVVTANLISEFVTIQNTIANKETMKQQKWNKLAVIPTTKIKLVPLEHMAI